MVKLVEVNFGSSAGNVVDFHGFPSFSGKEKLPTPRFTSLCEFYRRNGDTFVRGSVADLGRIEAKLLLLEMLRAVEKL